MPDARPHPHDIRVTPYMALAAALTRTIAAPATALRRRRCPAFLFFRELTMPTPRELEDKFWSALKSDRTMMLGLDGVEDGHARPMTAP